MANKKGSILLPSWTSPADSDSEKSDPPTLQTQNGPSSQLAAAPARPTNSPPQSAPSSSSAVPSTIIYMHCLNLNRNPVYINCETGEGHWTLPEHTPLHAVRFMTHWPDDAEGPPYYENLMTGLVEWTVPADAGIVSQAAQDAATELHQMKLSDCETIIGKIDSDASHAQLYLIDDYTQHIDDVRNGDPPREYDFEAELRKEVEAMKQGIEMTRQANEAKKQQETAAAIAALETAKVEDTKKPVVVVQDPPVSPEPERKGFLSSIFSFGSGSKSPPKPVATPVTPLSPPEPEVPSSSSSTGFKSHGHSYQANLAAEGTPRARELSYREPDRKSLADHATAHQATSSAVQELPSEGIMNGLLHLRSAKHKEKEKEKDLKDLKAKKDKDRKSRGNKQDDDSFEWTQRYFVLSQNVLTIYEDYVPVAERTKLHPHSQTSKGKSHLPLSELEVFGEYYPELWDADRQGKQAHVFRLVSVLGGELIRLGAGSEEERASWMLMLTECISHAKGKLYTYAHLKVGNSFFSSNKVKYFILNRDTLSLHPANDNVTKLEGSMKVDLTTGLDSDDHNKCKIKLTDKVPGGAKVEWIITFDDAATCTKWKTALEKLRNPPIVAPIEPDEGIEHIETPTPRARKKSVRIVDHREEAAEKERLEKEASATASTTAAAAAVASTATPTTATTITTTQPGATAAVGQLTPPPPATPQSPKPVAEPQEPSVIPSPPAAQARRVNPFSSPDFLRALEAKTRNSSSDPEEAANRFAAERKISHAKSPGSLGLADVAAAAAASARKRAGSNSTSKDPAAAREPPARPLSLLDEVTAEAARRRERAATKSGNPTPVAAKEKRNANTTEDAAASGSAKTISAPPPPPARTFPKVDTSSKETVPAPPPPPPPRVSLAPPQPPPPNTPSPRGSASASASAKGAQSSASNSDSATAGVTPPPPTSPNTPNSLSKGLHSISKLFSLFNSEDDKPLPKTRNAPAQAEEEEDEELDEETQALLDAGVKLCKARDHVQYYTYFRMYLQSGATAATAIREKMRSEGLDPALLDTPDKLISPATVPRPAPSKTPDMFYSGIDKANKKKISFGVPQGGKEKEGRPSRDGRDPAAPFSSTSPQPPSKSKTSTPAVKASGDSRPSESASVNVATSSTSQPAQPSVRELLGNRFTFGDDDDEEMTVVPSKRNAATSGSNSITIIAGGEGGVRTNRPFSSHVDISVDLTELDSSSLAGGTPGTSPAKAGSSRRSLFLKGGAALTRKVPEAVPAETVKKPNKTVAELSSEQRLKDFKEDALTFAPAVKKTVSAFAAAIPALSPHVKNAHAKHWDSDDGGALCINDKSDKVAQEARSELNKFRARTGMVSKSAVFGNATPSTIDAATLANTLATKVGGDREEPKPVHVRMQKDTRRVSIMSSGLPPSEEYKHFHPSADSGMASAPGRSVRACQTDDTTHTSQFSNSKPRADVPAHKAKSAFHLLLGESEAIKETLQRMREEELIIAADMAEEEERALRRVREYEAASMKRVQAAWAERQQAIEDERRVLLIDDAELREEQEKLHLSHNDAARRHGKCMADLLSMGQVLRVHHGRVLAERKLLLAHGVRLNSTLTQLTNLIRHPPPNEPRLDPFVMASQSPFIKSQSAYFHPPPEEGPGPPLLSAVRYSMQSQQARSSMRASSASKASNYPRGGDSARYPGKSHLHRKEEREGDGDREKKSGQHSEEQKYEHVEIEEDDRIRRQRELEAAFEASDTKRSGSPGRKRASGGSRGPPYPHPTAVVRVVHHVKPFSTFGKKIIL